MIGRRVCLVYLSPCMLCCAGSTSGQIFMTTCGMLILRARSRPMFGSIDYVMEEYMKLEDGGEVIVDRMCCLEVKSGNTASQ